MPNAIRLKLRLSALAATAGLIGAAAIAVNSANSQMAPFGGDEDVAYSKQLWTVLADAKLVGEGAIRTKPYEGTEPHGFVLETLYSTVTVNGHTGTVIVKRNYGPEGVSPEEIANDPSRTPAAVTVMFFREQGYDPDNKDIYWVKYLADGSLDKNPKGMQLAGRVAKGADAGCIACHSAAEGGDYEFLRDTAM
ncbi:MAG TPA: hypothetical protein VK862_14120 [Afifellaceae bacterium]|nr:hypothetical protein [Afifellaceae bacterium]